MGSLSGIARHHLRASNQIVAPADVIIIDPGAIHTTVAERASSWRFLSLHLPVWLLNRFQEENRTGSDGPVSFHINVAGNQKLYRQLIDLHRAVKDDLSPLFRDACLQELIQSLWSLSREPLCLPENFKGNRIALRLARDYLHEHFPEKIGLKELANLAVLSEFHFCRQFSRQFGMAPHAYQTQLRLLAAERLLRKCRPIAEVASAVGFHSQSHLTRTFLRIRGTTPARFQKTAGLCNG